MMGVHEAIWKDLDEFFSRKVNLFTFHKSFIYKWVEENKSQFCTEGDIKKIEELFRLTSELLSAKDFNTWVNFGFGWSKSNRHESEIKKRVVGHLEKVLQDLYSLSPHGEKTKQTIEMIEDSLANIDKIVLTKQTKRSESVEDIRRFLKKEGFRKESVDQYVKQFQKSIAEMSQEWQNGAKASSL